MAIYVVKDNASATGDRIWEFINAMLKAQEETGISLVLDKSGSIDLFDNLRNRFVRVKSAGESNYQLSYPYEHDNGRVKEGIVQLAFSFDVYFTSQKDTEKMQKFYTAWQSVVQRFSG